MTQQHGRRHEHDLNNSLNQVTTNDVWSTTVGYSGNSASDNCDLVVTLDPLFTTQENELQYNIEAKNITRATPGNRVSDLFTGSSGGETGLDEVTRLVETTPDWGKPVITLNFNNRKLVVFDARGLLAALGEMEWQVGQTVQMLQPKTTPSDNISVVAPTLEDWVSASASPRDAVVLAETLGLPIQYDDSTPKSSADTSASQTSKEEHEP